eukprot:1161751-Pelagomonas_calceolata.AAC.2
MANRGLPTPCTNWTLLGLHAAVHHPHVHQSSSTASSSTLASPNHVAMGAIGANRHHDVYASYLDLAQHSFIQHLPSSLSHVAMGTIRAIRHHAVVYAPARQHPAPSKFSEPGGQR